MALGAADRGADVQIVPFGINYNNAHRWRSRVLIDIGKGIKVSPDLIQQYRKGEKREAYATFLKQVEGGLRGVTFNAPDKQSLNILRCMRRLYQGDIQLPPKRFMELNRRFATAFIKFKDDERFLTLVELTNEYMDHLKVLNLTDRQVATFPPVGSIAASAGAMMNLLLDMTIVIVAVVFTIPGWIMFAPMLLRIRHVVKQEVQKALAGSSVKVEAKDVEASQKIMAALIWIPLTIIFWICLIVGLTVGLWPKMVSPYPPGSTLNWFFVNAVWLIPVAFIVLVFPYGMLSTFVFEFAARRARWLNRHFVVARGIFRPTTSTGGKIRLERKDLALRIQDFFEELVIPSIPEWRQDPIINRETIVDHRRQSDRKHAEEVAREIHELVSMKDLEASNPSYSPKPSSPKMSRQMNLELRKAINSLEEGMVRDMLANNSPDVDHPRMSHTHNEDDLSIDVKQ